MSTKRAVVFSALAIMILLLDGFVASIAASSEIKIAGFVDVLPVGPGGLLTLPLAPGAAPVNLSVSVGSPSATVVVQITSATLIETQSGLPVTITDGDRVKLEAAIVGGVLRALTLEVEDFPELELIGTASGLPTTGVVLPPPAGRTIDFVVSLGVSGVDVLVHATGSTKVEHGPLTLVNGAAVRVEAVVQSFQVIATEVAAGVDDGPGHP